MEKNESCYLGDGVYAEWDGVMVLLWTEREDGLKHRVYLETDVAQSLIRFLNRTILK